MGWHNFYLIKKWVFSSAATKKFKATTHGVKPAKIFGFGAEPKWKGGYGGKKDQRLKNEGYILLAITWITPF